MGRIQPFRLTLTTDADGAATATTQATFGQLVGYKIVVAATTTPTLTITDEDSLTLYTKATLASSTVPIAYKSQIADGTASTVTDVPPPFFGPLTATLASGGDAKTHTVILYVRR